MTAIRAITRVQDADDVTLAGAANNDPIVYDSSTGGLKKGTAGSADKLGLTPTAVKTSGYTAVAGDLVPVDTTSGAVTITLPNAPTDGSVVAVKHVIQGGTNAVTIACAGSDVFNKASGATSATLTLLAQGLLLQYKASGAIWYVVADDLPLSQLDTRYQAAGAVPATSQKPMLLPALFTFQGTQQSNPGANVAVAVPFFTPVAITVDRILLRITTSSGNVDVGIYNSDDTGGLPGTKVVSLGSTASPGSGQTSFTIASTVLQPGFYWIAFAGDNGTIQIRAIPSDIIVAESKFQMRTKASSFPLPSSLAGSSASSAQFYILIPANA